MSILEYQGSKRIANNIYELTVGNEFYTLLMAAARFADTDNIAKMEQCWPEMIAELRRRYNAPGGKLEGE